MSVAPYLFIPVSVSLTQLLGHQSLTQARKLSVHSLICESCALCAHLVHRHNKYY